MIESDPEDEDDAMAGNAGGVVDDDALVIPVGASGVQYDMDTDISKLEAPTFTTLDRGPSQTMINLKWDHKLNLIGKKVSISEKATFCSENFNGPISRFPVQVVNPMIHCCDKCLKPILIYGRMIPCKHVFCYTCAQSMLNVPNANGGTSSKCARCGDKVNRVEQASLGTIFMCSHGGSRYGNNGCRRTYLSQRDLEAHIKHRHAAKTPQAQSVAAAAPQSAQSVLQHLPSAEKIAEATAALASAQSRGGSSGGGSRSSGSYYSHRSSKSSHHFASPSGQNSRAGSSSSSQQHGQQQISVISGSSAARPPSNLITVPIQEGGAAGEPRTSDYYASASSGAAAGAYHGQQTQSASGYGSSSYYSSSAGADWGGAGGHRAPQSSSYYRRQ